MSWAPWYTLEHMLLLCAAVALFCANFLSGLMACLRRLGRLQAEEQLGRPLLPHPLRSSLHLFAPKQAWEVSLGLVHFMRHLLRLGFLLFAIPPLSHYPWWLTAGVLLAISILSEAFFLLLARIWKTPSLRAFHLLTSLLLLGSLPLSWLLLKFLSFLFPKKESESPLSPPARMREKLTQFLKESELQAYLDPNEQKLLLSIVSFKERIAREVMVPRINLFSFSVDTPLELAIQFFFQEGYSRIPVYKDSIDNIVGVLHYKDLLRPHLEKSSPDQKIHKLIKPALYTPETKKISQLLQEFRAKQIHLAIVVDEWGGTEGIVTIEDILEELVGEIADEYDLEHQELFSVLPEGGWIVDAKMSILDIQEELGVKIPEGPEYDTIGGYIFHRAGTIPSKGWKLHHDEFDLEILSSNERLLQKIHIIPR